MKSNETNREVGNSWINALKGIAICAVVMVHNVGMGFHNKIESIAAMG